MPHYKVTMVCKEIYRAEVIVEHDNDDQEAIKDKAWALGKFSKNLEQENYTKIEEIK